MNGFYSSSSMDDCLGYIRKNGFIPLDRGKTPYFDASRLASEAIQIWTGCAIRLKLPKDIRLLISKEMWSDKHVWIP
jgi:hypothetical protein